MDLVRLAIIGFNVSIVARDNTIFVEASKDGKGYDCSISKEEVNELKDTKLVAEHLAQRILTMHNEHIETTNEIF